MYNYCIHHNIAVGEVEGEAASDIMVTGKPWSMNTARVVDKYFAFLFAKKSEGSFHLDFRLICVIILLLCVVDIGLSRGHFLWTMWNTFKELSSETRL